MKRPAIGGASAFIDHYGNRAYIGGTVRDRWIISEGTPFPRRVLFHIEGGRSRIHPRTRYLRATSMIFSTKVANAMQSIATLITVRVSIGITS